MFRLFRCPRVALPALLACTAMALAAPARAQVPHYPDVMPLSAVRAGMKGYGLTVFQGTKIERFDVTVVGVVRKGSWTVPGHDMILVKLHGGPITERGAFKIQGMSGSPVYVNGKIIGAFSQAESMLKEPLGGVTPIEDMLEAWDPSLPTDPATAIEGTPRTLSLGSPLRLDGRTIRRVVVNAPAASDAPSHGDTLVLHQCATTVSLPSRSVAARKKLAAALAPYGVEVSQAGGTGQSPSFKGAPLAPGSAFSMMLSTGDFAQGAVGTITYRRGDRILGFGHPFMGIGPLEAPLCSAYIHDVYPLMTASYKIGTPGPIVGASTQDRSFSIAGIVGKTPRLIDVTVDVRDKKTGRAHVYRSQALQHPNLSSALVSVAVSAAVADIHGTPGAAFARVTTSVETDDLGKIVRSNTVFDTRGIDGVVTSDLDDILMALSRNPFHIVAARKVDVKVEIDDGRPTATIERIYLSHGRFRPGEQAEIGIVLKPYGKPAVTRTVKVAIPAQTQTGVYAITVRGGAPPSGMSLGGITLRPSGPPSEQAPPVNVKQMVDRLLQRERGNEMVVRLQLPTVAPAVEGERVSGLPPTIDALMRSPRSSSLRVEREEIKVIEPTEWIVSGQQTLSLDVQRTDVREVAAPQTSAPPAAGSTSPAASPASTADYGLGGPDSDDDLSTAARIGGQAGKPSTKGQAPAKPEPGKPAAPALVPDADTEVPAAPPAAPATAQIGRKAQTWSQTAKIDFAKGRLVCAAVTSTGDLSIARALKPLCATAEPFVWCVVQDGAGGVYAGTGTQAHVLHIDAAGKTTTVCELPEVSVHALLRDADGTLWAATSPNGRTYRIRPDGKPEVAHQAAEKHALCLAKDSAGRVYVGVGGRRGRAYRIGDGGKAEVVLDTAEEHVLALAFGPGDALYAGTAPSGMVFRVGPDGQARLLADTTYQSITGLSCAADGTLVAAATGPRGALIRIAPDGSTTPAYERSTGGFTSLCAAPDGTVYAAGSGSVYALRGAAAWPLDNATDVDVLGLCAAPDGALFAGTGNAGGILVSPAQPATQGTYESVAHDAGTPARWGHVRCMGSTPEGGKLTIETRSGMSAEPDASWSGWSPVGGADMRIGSPAARYLQYRVGLVAGAGGSPTLRDIALTYLPRNQAPKVSFQAPAGGEWWSGKQAVRWSATDPDKDTLSYELFIAKAEGGPWQAVAAAKAAEAPAQATPTPTAAPAPAPSKAKPAAKPQTVADVQAVVDAHPDMPAELRKALLDRAKELNAERDAAKADAPKAPAEPTVTRETTRTMETSVLADGAYRLKVVASDRPSNGDDAQQAEVVSERIYIANRLPLLLVSEAKVGADRRVEIRGVALHRTAPVSGVQYRVDGGQWLSAQPADGLFDTTLETFVLRTDALPAGQHTVEVAAFVASGVSAAEKRAVEVK